MMSLKFLFALIFVYLASILAIISIRPYAARLFLEDIPQGRKQHKAPTPVIGGIGVVAGFYAVMIFFGYMPLEQPAFWVASFLLFVVGLLDDMHEFGSKIKFIAQAIAALLMILWGHNKLGSLGDLFGTGDVVLESMAIPFTVFFVVGVINAFNLIDGVDGLCGSLSIVTTLSFAVASMLNGRSSDAVILFILSAALAGFLSLNLRLPKRPAALIFLGDAGALFVGFVIAWYAIKLAGDQSRIMNPIIVVWLLAVPVFDTLAVMTRRMMKRVSPFKADRTHIHHVLLDLGIADHHVVFILFLVATAFALIGLACTFYLRFSDAVMLMFIASLFALYCYIKKSLFSHVRKSA
ncbi:MraY family glycosyltransferase [Undibacterium sp. RuRC25W]|uniref:MraY family glycosyltransferase n=1 Tax=Undibacterium sp. RuRC25W TaxID=3413047 RepID=UPI003BF0FFB7